MFLPHKVFGVPRYEKASEAADWAFPMDLMTLLSPSTSVHLLRESIFLGSTPYRKTP